MPELTFSTECLEHLPVFLRHDDFIDGTPGRIVKYLIKHHSEDLKVAVKNQEGNTETKFIGQEMWKVRRSRLANDNFCEPILMQYLAFLTQQITFGSGLKGEPWDTLFADIDGLGTNHETFYRQFVWAYLGLGRVAAVVEGPPETAENFSDASARGERSFVTTYEGFLILKAERFSEAGRMLGKLQDLMIITDILEPDTNEQDRRMVVRRWWIENAGENYRSQEFIVKQNILDHVTGMTDSESSVKQWRKRDDVEVKSEEMLGDFQEIPAVVLGDGPRDSVLYGVVPRNHEHMNKKSVYDSINYYQGFQKLLMTGVDPDELSAWSESLVAVSRNESANVHVIEAGNPQALREDMDNIARDAFLAGFQRATQRHQLMTKSVQSAESKREDNAAFERLLEYIKDISEDAYQDVVRFMYMFETSNADPDLKEISVKIGDDFRISHTEEELAGRSLLYHKMGQWGQAGRRGQAEMVVAEFANERILGSENQSEEDIKREVIEGIRAEAKKEPQMLRLRDQVSRPSQQQGDDDDDLVGPDGAFDIASSIEQGANGAAS